MLKGTSYINLEFIKLHEDCYLYKNDRIYDS